MREEIQEELALPQKGELVHVWGVNSAGQRVPDIVGTVEGIEFRTTPPVLSVVADGRRYDVVNLGNGMEWELVS